jgi:adenylyltransferase/sulfurtransferase
LNENNQADRYSRQEIFEYIGKAGQLKLGRGKVVIIGCGGLGCTIANLLVRAGVGRIRIVDRDTVSYSNLHRQTLFDEHDVKQRLPKAIAAQGHLEAINSLVEIEGINAEVNCSNIEKYCSDMDVILDGLDNLEIRYLVNDMSLKSGIPFIFGGVLASMGMTMTIIPGVTPCFRCIFPDLPPPGTMPTSETEGILATAPSIIGSLEATEAIKLLIGTALINRDLIVFDIWNISLQRVLVTKRPICPACGGKYDFLGKKTT